MIRADHPVVVLTGGIATGKTAVSDRLGQLGARIIDTDLIAREVVQPGSAGLNDLIAEFGADILDSQGRLDRARMRERIFCDPEAKQRLEALVHPRIQTLAHERIGQPTSAPYTILVVPLLIESGLFNDADRVITVDLPESTQIERLCARDGIDETRARAILASQASRQARLERADFVIDNDTTPVERDRQVDSLHQTLSNLAAPRAHA